MPIYYVICESDRSVYTASVFIILKVLETTMDAIMQDGFWEREVDPLIQGRNVSTMIFRREVSNPFQSWEQ